MNREPSKSHFQVRSISLARIASAQGQVFWPSIDLLHMGHNPFDCKKRLRKPEIVTIALIAKRIDRS